MLIIFMSSFLGIYAWNGRLLEIVNVKTAKRNWIYSIIGIAIGLIISIIAGYYIMVTPELALELSTAKGTVPNMFWLTIFLLFLGGFIIGTTTQLYKLEFKKFAKENRKRLFYIGMILLGLGLFLLIVLLIPNLFIGA